MKGYLLQQQTFTIGQPTFVESNASENSFAVIFEDDTETGYFYAIAIDAHTKEQQILDAVHIYEVKDIDDIEKQGVIKIIWSTDWLKCALLINNYCHAIFDFKNQGGYSRNEFPPPNEFWTKMERKLTNRMVEELFE